MGSVAMIFQLTEGETLLVGEAGEAGWGGGNSVSLEEQ